MCLILPNRKAQKACPSSVLRHKMVRAPAHLRNFAVALFLVLDLRVREAAAQLDELITGNRSNWAPK